MGQLVSFLENLLKDMVYLGAMNAFNQLFHLIWVAINIVYREIAIYSRAVLHDTGELFLVLLCQ